jgi:DNA helicase II / ATP-dependent DNA helicase PcrA
MERAVPVAELLEAVLARTGYLEALEAEALGGAAKAIESQGRIENLDQLVEVAREFDAGAGESEATLDVFLQQLALVADADSRREDDGLVTLMTLHNAKGLEYPVVLIAGCEDGVFPHSRALQEGSPEEERRLFYVGVTRAKRELYLTYARRRTVFGSPTYGPRSRFIDEIPAELTDCEEELTLGRGLVGDGTGLVDTNGGLVGRRSGLTGDALGSGAATTSGLAAAAGAGTQRNTGMGRSGGARRRNEGTQRNGRARSGAWADAQAGQAAAAPAFRMGEDVVHAAFGEGVVTGLEPGGVIVVRFAGDGSERRLMAEYAPVSRR